ncbi:SPOR domain-containing protein [Rhodoferax sp.]|uniref:SPOR domain-containing protein n=1 Tax=Rhodoferax sp. TaxID=50421 RepID=UPI00260277AC|nr:SPOR domain-containing protein [Rhodoferax sp.]MDD2810298.1 SPOR domain-containing protein [Rhodoferax sp.]MDD4943944.1 SPOR domain-containing protein [Rhodoferax sp.]
MAFFKFRKAADEPASAPPPAPSIEAIRKRATYRLAGATVLVLLGVLGLPLLFDKQPRPLAIDTPIDIPDRNKVLPLAFPAAPASTVPAVPGKTVEAVAGEAGVITEKEEPNRPVAPVNKASEAIKSVAKKTPDMSPSEPPKAATSSALPAVKVVKSAPDKPAPDQPAPLAVPKVNDAAKAQALLNGTAPDTAPDTAPVAGRFVVQVGAFADATRAHEVRLKLERAGLKTYTHVADTKDGKRIRVRVGPFAVKAEAEKAAEKIKKLNLPAALLTL